MSKSSGLTIGARVLIASQDNQEGTVRFLGSTQFAAGTWVGVVLDGPRGKNDGSVKDVRYFECPPNYGIFCRPAACDVIKDTKSSPEKEELRKRSKRELAEAVEEHDLEEIYRIIDNSEELGLTFEDMEGAQRVLVSDVRQAMLREIDEVRESVVRMTDNVEAAQVSANVAAKRGDEVGALKAPGAKDMPNAWLKEVGNMIEEHMSQRLQKALESSISEVVQQRTSDMVITKP
mmetsp:Transcript_25185/g.45945  ORF Transcript_25185/g.45945 Transcript_25185/m.45945 type:complete len:233 (-) Transcript_25185:63-761(-)